MSTTSSLIANDPSIIGHTSALKEKRPRVSAKLRKRAKALEQELLFLQDKYAEVPELNEILQAAINAARGLADSSRQKDRDAVMLALEGFAALSLDEICDDTGLSRWVVGVILDEFITLVLVEVNPQYDPAPSQGSSPLLYSLIHSPALK
jgi:hypothetical protein